MGDAALTGQGLRAQIINDPAQAAALRELFGEGAKGVDGRVAIVLLDGDGIDAARAGLDLDSGPAAASVPSPANSRRFAPAGRGIVTDRSDNVIETTDGYRFEFDGNQVKIDWPGRTGDGVGETTFVGNNAFEADGTQWKAQDGNFVLPNGAMFTLDFDDDGKINNFTLVHGDSRVDVSGIGDGKPRIGNVRDGGYDFRMQRVESGVNGPTYRMGGTNDGYSTRDIQWNVEQYGYDLGAASSGGIDPFAGYVVDPNLRPPFGTEDYERMIRAEIEDVRSVISGNAQAAGASDAYGDQIADYMLGSSGTYDRYANELQESYVSRNGAFAGLPNVYGDFNQAMMALQQLMEQWMAALGMQNDYQAAASNLRSYIPSVQQAAQNQQQTIDPAMLVDQIVSGVGHGRQQNNRNRLEKFDLARGGYQGRTRGTDNSVARLVQHRVNDQKIDTTSGVARQTEAEVELNATRTAAAIHGAIAGIGTDQEALINQLSNTTQAERARLKEVYQDIYGESLEDAIDGDTWGEPEFRATLKSLLNSTARDDNVVDDIQATQDAAALHEAIDSQLFNPSTWGTDEDKLRDILTNRSPAEIKRIAEIYEQTYGEPLRDAIEGDVWDNTFLELNSGFRDTLMNQLDRADEADYTLRPESKDSRTRTRATQAAMAVRNAVKGAGTDHQTLIRTLSGLSNDEKAELRRIYQEMYGTTVQDDIEWDTSFNFESTLVRLINNDRSEAPATELQATRDAAALHRAIAGWGTYDNDLQELLTTRSPAQLRAMARVYEDIYKESAQEAIEGDTSGWYETALVHQLSLQDFE